MLCRVEGRKMQFLIVVVCCCLLAWIFPVVFSQPTVVASFPYTPPSSCGENEFFNSGNLSCTSCETNSTQSSDGFSCVCDPGYVFNLATSTCQACPENQVASSDGLFCLECVPGYDLASLSCVGCARTSRIVETLPQNQGLSGNFSCEVCPTGTWATPTLRSCSSCGVEDCSSCSEDMVSGGVCFDTTVEPLTSVPFSYYGDHYTAALRLCGDDNETACQLLLNLCVLQQYDSEDPACSQSVSLASTKPDLVPPLFYPQFGADEYLETTTISTQFITRSTDSGSSSLPLVAAQYMLNGSFGGLFNLTDQISLCTERPSRAAAAWETGVHYEIVCLINMQDLMSAGIDPEFYDLFLVDENSLSEPILIPIPILITNYLTQTGTAVNQESDPENWQFVRRLFLSQSVTNTPSYAESMQLKILLDAGGHVRVPFLQMSYATIPMGTNVMASFSVTYEQTGDAFNIGLSVSAALLVILATVYTGFKVIGFVRRDGSTFCEPSSMVFMVVQFTATMSSLLVLLLVISAGFYLVFFKGQITLFIALPVGNQETAFITLVIIALFFRILDVLYFTWKQSNIDIFLMDWERPRGMLLPTNKNSESDDSKAIPSPVSIWRTYFVANEWNEIQSLRKISPTLVLVAVILFLEVFGIKHLAEEAPTGHTSLSVDRYSAPHSRVLRFAMATLLYVFFAAMLRLYMILIHERFVENKIAQFTDLCSVSNVSVLILRNALFGYYIHGRSVHGRADTNMREMNENLIKEQNDLCSRRGLVADSDEQTFQVAFSRNLQHRYVQILQPIMAERAEGQAHVVNTHTQQLAATSRLSGVTEVSLKAYEDMNQFLTSVIEHGISDCDYVIKKKLLLERILGVEFYDAVDRSLFYSDPDSSFSEVLFYGNEWSLLSLEILIFSVVDLASQNFVLAATITYIVTQVLLLARGSLGKRNLGRRTLVDERFLI